MTTANASGRSRPRRRDRLVRWLGIALVVMLAPILTLAGTVAATGTIMVSVHERGPDGVNLWIPVPALVADVGLLAADALIPSEALDPARAEMEQWMPTLLDMADAIEDCPDATLVEVVTRDEIVHIRKAGRNFEIDVRSDDTDVSVRVPARLLGSVVSVLG